MKYEVSGIRRCEATEEIFAESPHQAAVLFRAIFPDFGVTDVIELLEKDITGGAWNSVGRCEGCGKEIFDLESYRVDEDGNRFCAGCCAESR